MEYLDANLENTHVHGCRSTFCMLVKIANNNNNNFQNESTGLGGSDPPSGLFLAAAIRGRRGGGTHGRDTLTT